MPSIVCRRTLTSLLPLAIVKNAAMGMGVFFFTLLGIDLAVELLDRIIILF